MAASSSTKLFLNNPIVVILGATGTGKSRLAIEVAKKFKGEVISADAMQMYKGLDIATNKVTEAEQDGVPHYLLGFLDPVKKLTVCEFRNYAFSAIKDIITRDKLPIIVGGTHYYIESILYTILFSPTEGSSGERNEDSSANVEDSLDLMDEILPRKKLKLDNYKNVLSEYEKLDNEKLHEKLGEVDPELAKKLHPNDRRKILRSLMVHEQFGETLSSLLNKQRSLPGGGDIGGPLRFTNSIILWITCNIDVLLQRLDARVDNMLAQGLTDELLDFHKKYNEENLSENKTADYTKGIFQSIGFKEFHEYLILNEERRESEEGKKLFENGVELLKIATRQYAKRQIKWIKNRFLRDCGRQVPPIYELDGSDVSKWKENVYDKAEEIIEAHLIGRRPSMEPSKIEGKREVIDKIYKCEICQKRLMGVSQWEVHLKSAKHARVVKRKNRLEKQNAEKKIVLET